MTVTDRTADAEEVRVGMLRQIRRMRGFLAVLALAGGVVPCPAGRGLVGALILGSALGGVVAVAAEGRS